MLHTDTRHSLEIRTKVTKAPALSIEALLYPDEKDLAASEVQWVRKVVLVKP